MEAVVERNKTQWKGLGFVPKDNERPVRIEKRRGQYYWYEAHFYSEEQVRPLKKQTKKAARAPKITPQSVADAVWIVNQSAKRYRDAARNCYEVGAFQFATINKAKKEKLYGVKDRGIRWLISEGHLICKAKHGDRYLWSGLGFSFHSSAVPQVMPTNVSNERVFIEAKLNVKQSIRLKDAVFLIENIGGNAWNKTQKFAAEKLKRQNDD